VASREAAPREVRPASALREAMMAPREAAGNRAA
jgi:hypothetical protein